MKHIYLSLGFLIILPFCLFAQKDTTTKLLFTGDFRFRVEQDWNSQKSDGSYRDDRTRLRYRLRFGFDYHHNKWAAFGMRLRTGYMQNQQDPHLTLGTGFKEFGTLPIGFEKLFLRVEKDWFLAWFGKNTFPFKKQNELFWSDNVYPEGVFVSAKVQGNSSLLQSLSLGMGHFIVGSTGTSFNKDRYFQGVQLISTHWNNRLQIFPALYYFRQMPNIPDGNDTYDINYSIFHLGTKVKLIEKPSVTFGLDYYKNFEDLSKNNSVPQSFLNQDQGAVGAIALGGLKMKGDWMVQISYAYLEKYAAVDFLSQNDWVRWDYSGQGSSAGRLTNFQGLELMAAYLINKKFRLKMRYFIVEQIVPYGIAKETGNRIRLDLDIGF